MLEIFFNFRVTNNKSIFARFSFNTNFKSGYILSYLTHICFHRYTFSCRYLIGI